MEAAPVHPKPTVDLSTLAIYRALMDHNYSTITPSALIEAVMLKHDYVCTFQALQDFPADMEPYEPVSAYLNHQRIKPEPGVLLQSSQRDESQTIVLNPKKGRKRKAAEDKLVKNPKYKSPAKSAKTPILLSNDETSLAKSPKLLSNDTKPPSPKKPTKTKNTPEPSKEKKEKKSSEVAKTADSVALKKDKEKERKSLASKLRVELRLKRRKRRKNTTGWPTKRPQAADKKPKKLSKPKKDKVTKVKNEKTSRDTSSTRNAEKDSTDIIPSLSGIVLSIEEAVKRRRQSVSKSTSVEKPSEGNERTKKRTRSSTLKKPPSQTAMKTPVKGKRKPVAEDKLTKNRNETKESADVRTEDGTSGGEQPGSEIESQRSSTNSQTTPSRGQKSLAVSPKKSQKPVKTQPEDTIKTPDPPESAPETRSSVRKKVKSGFMSLFKPKCTSKNVSPQQTEDIKRQKSTNDEAAKEKIPRKSGGAGSDTESASEGENPSQNNTSTPALKKGLTKLKSTGKKSKKIVNKSTNDSSKTNAKSEKQKKRTLRKRNAPFSPPTKRGEECEKIESTEDLQTFSTVIIKEEPMETEIPDDSQPADWDHFQNLPDNRENSLAKTRYSQELDDRLQTESCQFFKPRQSTSESKVDVFAPIETHSGRNSDDLTCYEELAETSEELNSTLSPCFCEDRLTDNSSEAMNLVGQAVDSQAVEKSISAAENYHTDPQNLKSLDGRPDAAKAPAADFCLTALHSINKEESQRWSARQKSEVYPSDFNTSESKMESVDSLPSEQNQLVNFLKHEICRNINEMKPQENIVPKYEGITKHSTSDVDAVLKKRRDERRLARERRLKKRYALRMQELHHTKSYSQCGIASKSKFYKITDTTTGDGEIQKSIVQAESKTVDKKMNTPECPCIVNEGPDDSVPKDDESLGTDAKSSRRGESCDKGILQEISCNEIHHDILRDSSEELSSTTQQKSSENSVGRVTCEAEDLVRNSPDSSRSEDSGKKQLKGKWLNPAQEPSASQGDVEDDLEELSSTTQQKSSENSAERLTCEAEDLVRNSPDSSRSEDSGKKQLKGKWLNSAQEPSASQDDVEDDLEELSGSGWVDSPLESSNENSNVDFISRDISLGWVISLTEGNALKPKPAEKAVIRFNEKFRRTPRILRRNVSSLDRGAVRAVQAPDVLRLNPQEKLLDKDRIAQSDHVELHEEPKARESRNLPLSSGKDQPELQKRTVKSNGKPESPISLYFAALGDIYNCVNQAQLVGKLVSVSETSNDTEVQNYPSPVLNDHARNKDIMDVRNEEPGGAEPLFGMLHIEPKDLTEHGAKGTTVPEYAPTGAQRANESNAGLVYRCNVDASPSGMKAVIDIPEVAVTGSVDTSAPVESANPTVRAGLLPNRLLSLSNDVFSLASLFGDHSKENSSYDSDFSILDPYASDSDDPSSAAQLPLPQNHSVPEADLGSSTNEFPVIVKEVKPVDSSASAKGVGGVGIVDRKVLSRGKDPLHEAKGLAEACPKQTVKGFILPTTGPRNTPVVVGQPVSPVVSKPIATKPPLYTVHSTDHGYCIDPLKMDIIARRNERIRILREQKKKALADEQTENRNELADTNQEPIMIRYDPQKNIARIDGLLSGAPVMTGCNAQSHGATGALGGLPVKDAADRNPHSLLVESDDEYLPLVDEKHQQRVRRGRRKRLLRKRRENKLLRKPLQDLTGPLVPSEPDPLGSDQDPLNGFPTVPGVHHNQLIMADDLASEVSGQMDTAKDPLEDVPDNPSNQPLRVKPRADVSPALHYPTEPPLTSGEDPVDPVSTDIPHLRTSPPEPKNQVFQKRTLCFKVVGGKMEFQGELKQKNSDNSTRLSNDVNLDTDQGKVPQMYKTNFQGADGKRFSVITVAPSKSVSAREFGTDTVLRSGASQGLTAPSYILPKPVSSIHTIIGQVVRSSRSYGIDTSDSSVRALIDGQTSCINNSQNKLPETPRQNPPRTPSPADPPTDENTLPIGSADIDWKKVEYFPPREVAKLYYRIRRRLFGEAPFKHPRLYYRKGGRPPYSYIELAAMAIENEPLKTARFSSMVEFAVKHFRYYRQPHMIRQAKKGWQHAFRTAVWESSYLRNNRLGWHSYYSFKSQYRLPADPTIFENMEEVLTDSGSEGCDEPEPGLAEAEPNPLVPVCDYSDEEMEAARESLVEHVNEFLALGNKELSQGDDVITTEDLESVFPKKVHHVEPEAALLEPTPSVEHDPIGSQMAPNSAKEDRVYDCSYCTATFASSEDALDHAMSHSEVTKKCPACEFISPDGIQMLWHVNAYH